MIDDEAPSTMAKARCAFDDCKSAVITINPDNIVHLPNSVLDDYHLMQLPKGENEAKTKNEFLVVNDVWDFDNIGVSKDILNSIPAGKETDEVQFRFEGKCWRIDQCIKYLICSDCDKGPIGIVCSLVEQNSATKQTKMAYILSLESVKQQ